MSEKEVNADVRTPAAGITGARLRILLAVAAALVACRVFAAWHSVAAMYTGLAVMGVVAAGFVWARPRLRRVFFYLALPWVVLAEAAVLAVAGFLAFMAARDLLPPDTAQQAGPAGVAYFGLAGAVLAHLAAVARPSGLARRRRLGLAAVCSLSLAAYGLWLWNLRQARTGPGPQVPEATLVLVAVAIAAYLIVLMERPPGAVCAEAAASEPPMRRRPWRAGLVAIVSLAVCLPLWTAMAPEVQKRSLVRSLENLGFQVDEGAAVRPRSIWRSLLNRHFFHRYVIEPRGVIAEELKPDDGEAERLLSQTPALEYIAITRSPVNGDRILRLFAGSMSLYGLKLGGKGVTDATLAEVAKLPSMDTLALPDSRITDRGLSQLAGLKSLSRLEVRGAPISGEGLAALQALRLNQLDLSDTGVGDDQLVHLQGYRSLQILVLGGTHITDAGLQYLLALPRISVLDLSGTQVSDAGMKQFAGAPRFIILKLADTSLTDAGISELVQYDNLAGIDLSRTRVTDAALREMPAFKNLRMLSVNGTEVTDAGLELLPELPWLSELELAGTRVTDEGLADLARLRHLNRIDLRNTSVTRAGVEQLRQAFPDCYVQWGELPASP